MSKLLDFYHGESTDTEGRRFADILAWSDDELEEVHDFIQWLFPLPAPSRFNPDAPLLTESDIAAFGKSPDLKANLKKAFDRFLSFLGLTRSGDAIVEAAHFARRVPEVWNVPNHNWLRISRVLASMTLLGLRDDASRLFAWLESESTRRRFPISAETFRYWSDAIKQA